MSRSIQGLLFAGVALFALKWSFYGSHDKPVLVDADGPHYPASFHFVGYTPWGVPDKLIEVGILTGVGAYLWLTGEVAWWLGRGRHSRATTAAVLAAFVSVFLAKWSYHRDGPGGYYPPFDRESLLYTNVGFWLLAAYYLLIGEVQFWHGKEVWEQGRNDPKWHHSCPD